VRKVIDEAEKIEMFGNWLESRERGKQTNERNIEKLAVEII
jgi:hypothetical protein